MPKVSEQLLLALCVPIISQSSLFRVQVFDGTRIVGQEVCEDSKESGEKKGQA